MRKMERPSEEAEKAARDIRRATRRQYSAEEFTRWARLEAEILLLR
jgi:outer membrane protein TolC